MEYYPTTAAIQFSTDCALQYLAVAVIGIAIVGFLFNYFNKESDPASDNTRVAVKIDRRGNYRYESVPDEGNNAMAMWLKILFVVIALALLFVPINAILNRS